MLIGAYFDGLVELLLIASRTRGTGGGLKLFDAGSQIVCFDLPRFFVTRALVLLIRGSSFSSFSRTGRSLNKFSAHSSVLMSRWTCCSSPFILECWSRIFCSFFWPRLDSRQSFPSLRPSVMVTWESRSLKSTRDTSTFASRYSEPGMGW